MQAEERVEWQFSLRAELLRRKVVSTSTSAK